MRCCTEVGENPFDQGLINDPQVPIGVSYEQEICKSTHVLVDLLRYCVVFERLKVNGRSIANLSHCQFFIALMSHKRLHKIE